VNILDRGGQVHEMAEFQEMLDFPPAPKVGSLQEWDRYVVRRETGKE
jgi:hypothetical protein